MRPCVTCAYSLLGLADVADGFAAPASTPHPNHHMQKLLLMSVLIATFVIPSRLATRYPHGVGYRTLVRPFLAFCAFYALALIYIYPRL